VEQEDPVLTVAHHEPYDVALDDRKVAGYLDHDAH
jgi:hypothetical protein